MDIRKASRVSDLCVWVCVKMIYPGRKEYKKECVCVCVELWVGEWNERPWPGAALTWAIITTALTLSLPKRGDATREHLLSRPYSATVAQHNATNPVCKNRITQTTNKKPLSGQLVSRTLAAQTFVVHEWNFIWGIRDIWKLKEQHVFAETISQLLRIIQRSCSGLWNLFSKSLASNKVEH